MATFLSLIEQVESNIGRADKRIEVKRCINNAIRTFMNRIRANDCIPVEMRYINRSILPAGSNIVLLDHNHHYEVLAVAIEVNNKLKTLTRTSFEQGTRDGIWRATERGEPSIYTTYIGTVGLGVYLNKLADVDYWIRVHTFYCPLPLVNDTDIFNVPSAEHIVANYATANALQNIGLFEDSIGWANIATGLTTDFIKAQKNQPDFRFVFQSFCPYTQNIDTGPTVPFPL